MGRGLSAGGGAVRRAIESKLREALRPAVLEVVRQPARPSHRPFARRTPLPRAVPAVRAWVGAWPLWLRAPLLRAGGGWLTLVGSAGGGWGGRGGI